MIPVIYELKVERKDTYAPIFDKKITSVKKIVLDSVSSGNLLGKLTAEQEVNGYINFQLTNGKKGKFHNYIIATNGDIYNLVSPDTAGNVCVEDVYSERACSYFPMTCSPCDGRVTPHTTRPDTELLSICTISLPKEDKGSVDTGTMSSPAKEALETLIQYLIRKYNAEAKASLDSNSLILRNVFPGLADIKRGHALYRDDPTQFLILKRNIGHQISYPNVSDYNNLVKISEISQNT